MKKRLFLFGVLPLILFCKCNYSSHTDNGVKYNDDQMEAEKPNAEDLRDEIAKPKDTLFSVITSDQSIDYAYNKLLGLSESKTGNFKTFLYPIETGPLSQPTTGRAPGYVFHFNDDSYHFDIDINDRSSEPGIYDEVEGLVRKNSPSEKIFFMSLIHKTKNDNKLVHHLVDLFKQKYGPFQHTKKYENSYGIFDFIPKDRWGKDPPVNAYIEIDEYLWDIGKKILISHTESYRVAYDMEYIDNPYYEYETEISYFSNEFYNTLRIVEAEKPEQIRQEKERRQKNLLDDI